MKIGEKIKYFRTAHNMTQEQLSKESGISLNTLRKYEACERNPKSEQLLKLSGALGISINIFMDFDIHTASDVLSLIFKMNEQLDMKFHYNENPDGTVAAESLSISFEHPLINQKLASYLSFLKKASDAGTSYSQQSLFELENQLLDDNTEIHKDTESADIQQDIQDENLTDPSYQKLQSLLMGCTSKELEYILKSAQILVECSRYK